MKVARSRGATFGTASVAIGALIFAGCSANSSPSSQPTLVGQVAVQQRLDELTANGGPPGAVLVIQTSGEPTVLTSGSADVGTNQSMSADASTRIASVSKPYSGAILVRLASQGKLTLGSRIGKLLPTLPKAWGSVSVAQLLQHSSGIPDYIKDEQFLRQFIANPQMQRTPQQLVGYVAGDPLEFVPGTRYEYSDTDNIVAGLIAERVAGKPYQDVLANEVTQPLSLSKTSLPASSALSSPFIHGYAVDPADPVKSEDVSELINPGLAWASGGMISTGNELNTFVRGLLSGKLFDARVLTDSAGFRPGAGGPPGPGVNASGLSIYRYSTRCGIVYGHTGNMPGYTAFVAATADGNASMSLAINSQVTPKNAPEVFERLIAVETQAICAMHGTASPPTMASSATAS